tara:strand:- start:618 stop:797 length:180 start_codon:yes stop_codon:yes gene_type:complete
LTGKLSPRPLSLSKELFLAYDCVLFFYDSLFFVTSFVALITLENMCLIPIPIAFLQWTQ